MFFYTLAALLATIVLATQVQSNPTTFRNQRNNKLRTLRNNLLEIKLGQSLLQVCYMTTIINGLNMAENYLLFILDNNLFNI